jgi:hypothetical protein
VSAKLTQFVQIYPLLVQTFGLSCNESGGGARLLAAAAHKSAKSKP